MSKRKGQESPFRKRLFSKQRNIIREKARIRDEVKELENQLREMRKVYDNNWTNVYSRKTIAPSWGSLQSNRSQDPIYNFLNSDKNPFVYMKAIRPFSDTKEYNGTPSEYLKYLFECRDFMYQNMRDDYNVKNFAKIMRKDRLRGLLS